MMNSEEYKSGLDRIKRANTKEALLKLCDVSFPRLYEAGIFTEKEYAKLDVKIMEKLALIEE